MKFTIFYPSCKQLYLIFIHFPSFHLKTIRHFGETDVHFDETLEYFARVSEHFDETLGHFNRALEHFNETLERFLMKCEKFVLK